MDLTKLHEIVGQLRSLSDANPDESHTPTPDRKRIIMIIKELHCGLFPDVYSIECEHLSVESWLMRAADDLECQIELALSSKPDARQKAAHIAEAFMQKLPSIRQSLCYDIEALYEGDPAAISRQEIILCYPGFYAISIYRMAHVLYEMGVPLLPRVMTEYAHEKTGIDIHAGATIGSHFFIDHGTGVVIGETTVIGDHVKLYQGVTLGAKSFDLDDAGNPIKGIKRHPNIGDHVVIYANATLLGGDLYVGEHSIIGGSVWLTESVPPHSIITCEPQVDIRTANKSL